MPLTAVTEDGVCVVEGTPGQAILSRPQDATLIIEACFSARTRSALVYPENLTSAFFDLSSAQAGEILEKLRRVNMRLAIVCARGSVKLSSRFLEILSDDLRMFETRAEARLWLGNTARKTQSHS
jgi:hypothetical protein